MPTSRRGGTLRVRGKVTNAMRVGQDLERVASGLDNLIDRGIRELGSEAVDMLRLVAPKGRTKQLERGIQARRRGIRGLDVTVHAISPESGYDYAAVTRFGHRVDEITPTEGRQALRIRFQSGDVGFFNRVRGFQPVGDWVDQALPSISVRADEVMNNLGRELDLRLFS